MKNKLSCEQVAALFTFFVEDKLSPKLSQYMREHLELCPECMNKYIEIKRIMNKYIEVPQSNNQYLTKQYEDFKQNLSAYVDNELDDTDSIKIKKIAISNPLARQDLENIFSFKQMLHNTFEKTKNDLKTDYSKAIICQIQQELEMENSIDPFFKFVTAFFIMIICLLAGIVGILYL